MVDIAIIDYGLGNLDSVANMFKRIGSDAIITSQKEILSEAKKLVLPGVGAFDTGMTNLKENGMIEVLNKKVVMEKVPILGICLGMQLMTLSSEEGNEKGLGWIDANTLKFKFDLDKNIKIPHMGWNEISIYKDSRLAKNLYNDARFYFVHSFYVKCNNLQDQLFMTNYGGEICSAFEKDNIFGVQFHPEKSHKFGMRLFENFVNL